MPNNSTNTTSNGRNSSSSSGSNAPTQKNEKQATTTATPANNNETANNHHLKATTANVAQHRRDNSSLSGHSKRDPSKYQYSAVQSNKLYNLKEPDRNTPPPDTLLFYDGELISGSQNALITHCVPTSEYYPEKNFIFSFLLSFRLFVRPHELLAQISQTWERQQQESQNSSPDEVDEALRMPAGHLVASSIHSASPLLNRKMPAASPICACSATNSTNASSAPRSATQISAQNCIRLLAEWVETFPYDFRDERLMQQVRILARKCVYIDNALGKQVSRVLQLIAQRLTALQKYEEFLQTLLAADLTQHNAQQQQQHYGTSAAASAATQSNSSVLTKTLHALGENTSSAVVAAAAAQYDNHSEIQGLMDLCPSCATLAHQLTAIELQRLSHIGPEEFVQAFAKEYSINKAVKNSSHSSSTNSDVSFNDLKKTRNLESYVEWFNRLSYLTASEIVKYPKKKQRVRVIEYWIETARECFNIGNFNSLMAIIAGLNLEPISRLKKTWSKVQSAKFSVLEHQMDPTSNFNSYRSTLKAAMWRSEGATDDSERIIIPFFSLFVKDLYFLNEGCSNRLPNNHINFEKCSQLAKQIMEFNEWKKVSCPFEQVPQVITHLQTSQVLNENTLSMASFECEPPENSDEKGRYKTVKAETKQQLLQQLQQEQQNH